MNDPRYASRFRYLDAVDVDDGLVTFAGLDVMGADGERIGSVDGFVIDVDAHRVNHIVIDSGGWFTSRRLLLPIGHTVLAEDRKSLRTDVTRDALRRLPEFEADRFGAFTDGELHAFERNTVLACCPDEPLEQVAVQTWDYDSQPHFRQPEWWAIRHYAPEHLRPFATTDTRRKRRPASAGRRRAG